MNTKLFIIYFSFFLASCDNIYEKFEKIEISTQSDFKLDSFSHDFEIKANKGVSISSISVNGISRKVEFVEERYYGIAPPVYECEDYRIIYDENGHFVEVAGTWFNIKLKDNNTTIAMSIYENKTNNERNLDITLSGIYLLDKDITIKQSKE